MCEYIYIQSTCEGREAWYESHGPWINIIIVIIIKIVFTGTVHMVLKQYGT